jgi:hypothetical protein
MCRRIEGVELGVENQKATTILRRNIFVLLRRALFTATLKPDAIALPGVCMVVH